MVLNWYSKRDLSRHDKDNEQLSLFHDMEEGRVVFRTSNVSYVHWPKDSLRRQLMARPPA
jgi:hypothetical protein